MLLRCLAFNVELELPYAYLIRMLECFNGGASCVACRAVSSLALTRARTRNSVERRVSARRCARERRAASACLAAAGSALGSHERVCKAIGVDCAHVARESCAVRCALCPLSRSIARLACTEYLLRCQRELRLLAVVDRDASDALD